MSGSDQHDDRLTNLEMLVTHLQHDLDQMSDVVLHQQAEIAELKSTLQRLQSELADLADDQGPPPPLERPPHY